MNLIAKIVKNVIYRSLHATFFIYAHVFLCGRFKISERRFFSDQYAKVNTTHLFRLRTLPNLKHPQSFNDKIAWLMIHDYDKNKIICSDKLLVKDYIEYWTGDNYCPKTIAVYLDPEDIDPSNLPNRCVIKTNHDSGTVFIVLKEVSIDWSELKTELRERVKIRYGAKEGEWPYQHIEPKIFAEEYLGSTSSTPPDFKFHCSQGSIAFVQYIYDRDIGPKEVILDGSGTNLGVQLDEKFNVGVPPDLPKNWNDMCALAELLSTRFQYVRVDMYSIDCKIYVGELTFYPRAGCYSGVGQRVLGERFSIGNFD